LKVGADEIRPFFGQVSPAPTKLPSGMNPDATDELTIVVLKPKNVASSLVDDGLSNGQSVGVILEVYEGRYHRKVSRNPYVCLDGAAVAETKVNSIFVDSQSKTTHNTQVGHGFIPCRLKTYRRA